MQELVVEVRKLQDTQVHMANRIERIVYILQNALRDMYVSASERASDCAISPSSRPSHSIDTSTQCTGTSIQQPWSLW